MQRTAAYIECARNQIKRPSAGARPQSHLIALGSGDILSASKSVCDDFTKRGFVRPDKNLDNIEPVVHVCTAKPPHPGTCAFGNETLLSEIDRFIWTAKCCVAPRFHLDENEKVSVTANEVNLTTATWTVIAAQDLVAKSLEMPFGQFLALASEFMPRVDDARRKKLAAPPGETNSDGLDRAHHVRG